MTFFSLFLTMGANAQEENRIFLKHFSVPNEASACRKFISVSSMADGIAQVNALLALPESKLPSSSLAQVLGEAHLKLLPQHSLALGQQRGGPYFIPTISEGQGNIIRFIVAAEQEGKATAFLLKLEADAQLKPRSVSLSSLDGNERYVLDLTTGESYFLGSSAQLSTSSTLACLWDAISNSMPSFGTLVCSWGDIVTGCLATALSECPGIVGGVLGGVACATGVDIAKNWLLCFGGSDTTPPSITSFSPNDGATVTTPFTISCQASDSSGIQAISLVFDSTTVATCSGSPCSGSVNLTVANTGVRHVVTCVAKDGANLSASQSHSVWVNNGGGVPTAPTSLSASALSSSSIKFSWQDNSSNETGFKVYRLSGSTWQLINTVGANVTSYTDSGLQPSTTYYYTVCATNSTGSGCASGSTSATTQSGSTAPAAPSGLSASALSSSSIKFSWQDNSNNENGFAVYRWNGSTWQQISTVGANMTSYTDGGLQASTTYYYTVCATNNAGSGCASGYTSATTPQGGSTLPAAPSGLSASALSTSSIRFSWQDNSNNETGFLVYRWTGSVWQQIATVGTNMTSYTNSGLASGTTYYYSVCAVNSAGTSCASNYTSATTH
jgi:fibronectin type 3 domain-containing protein